MTRTLLEKERRRANTTLFSLLCSTLNHIRNVETTFPPYQAPYQGRHTEREHLYTISAYISCAGDSASGVSGCLTVNAGKASASATS